MKKFDLPVFFLIPKVLSAVSKFGAFQIAYGILVLEGLFKFDSMGCIIIDLIILNFVGSSKDGLTS